MLNGIFLFTFQSQLFFAWSQGYRRHLARFARPNGFGGLAVRPDEASERDARLRPSEKELTLKSKKKVFKS